MKKMLKKAMTFMMFFWGITFWKSDANAYAELGNVQGTLTTLQEMDICVGQDIAGQSIESALCDKWDVGYWLEDGSYVLFDKGQLIELNRIDYVTNLIDNANSRKSENVLIKFEEVIPEDYILTDEYMFDESTKSLMYTKLIDNDILSTYDSYIVYIDIEKNQIEYVYHNISPDNIESTVCIDQDKAINIASQFLSSMTDFSYEGLKVVKTATIKTNNFFDQNREVNIIQTAYVISNGEIIIYIDVNNGEILGGDIYKSSNGGTVGTPTIYTASSSLNLANTYLSNLGYGTVSSGYTQYLAGAPSYMKMAFYACCHGSATQLMGSVPSPPQSEICSYLSVPAGTYKFVFLDACETGSATYWSSAFGIYSGTSGKAFLGWAKEVPAGNALAFCQSFWPRLNGNTSVRTAAIQAAAAEGSGLPVWFMGDQNYNGYY